MSRKVTIRVSPELAALLRFGAFLSGMTLAGYLEYKVRKMVLASNQHMLKSKTPREGRTSLGVWPEQ